MSAPCSSFEMADDRTLRRDASSGRHCYSLRSANSLTSSDLVSNTSNTSAISSVTTCNEPIYPRPGPCQSPVNSVQSHNRPCNSTLGVSKRKSFSAQTDLLEEEDEDDLTPSAQELRGKKRRKKFVGVRQRPSGRWVAEIKDTTQKIRLWLGTFDCAEDAARAYDEAACLLRGNNARTNFVPHPSSKASPLASKVAQMLQVRRHHARNSVGYAIPKTQNMLSSLPSQGRRNSFTGQEPLVDSPSSGSDIEDDDNGSLIASPTGSLASVVCTLEDSPSGFELWARNNRANVGDIGIGRESPHREGPKPSLMVKDTMESSANQARLKSRKVSEMRSSWQQSWMQEETDQQKGRSFMHAREDQNLIQSTDKNLNEEPLLKLQKGGYMDAVLGLNDDILGSAEMDLASQIEAAYYPPFDFCVEASLDSTMQVDDFPLISELSDKLEEAVKTTIYGEGSENSEEINDETIKRMRFERRVSASLYALNGVHEVMMKQSHNLHNTNSATSPGSTNTSSTAINFPLVAENSDPQSQEAAMWNSWNLSPLCPLSVS